MFDFMLLLYQVLKRIFILNNINYQVQSLIKHTIIKDLLFLPFSPVVVKDLHVKPFASLGNFITNLSHSNDA